MFKSRILAFFLLTAFSLQAFSRLVIVTNYHLNTAAFLQHCVNKARPKLKCKGQCQMMKQLDAEEKRQNAPSENKFVEINPILFFENNITAVISPDLQASGRCFPRPADDRLLQRSGDVFRPPA